MELEGVVGILSAAQHSSLCLLSDTMQSDFIGLAVAARAARRSGVISGVMARKLERLDFATHIARHATKQRMNGFLSTLVAEVAMKKPKVGCAHDNELSPSSDSSVPGPAGGIGCMYVNLETHLSYDSPHQSAGLPLNPDAAVFVPAESEATEQAETAAVADPVATLADDVVDNLGAPSSAARIDLADTSTPRATGPSPQQASSSSSSSRSVRYNVPQNPAEALAMWRQAESGATTSEQRRLLVLAMAPGFRRKPPSGT